MPCGSSSSGLKQIILEMFPQSLLKFKASFKIFRETPEKKVESAIQNEPILYMCLV